MENTLYIDKMSVFEKFLNANSDKIRAIAPTNPVITKDDEWYHEDTWDEHYKEISNGN